MSLKPAVTETDHSQGNGSASLTIVEYGDYQCPHCGKAHPVIKKILDTFGDQVLFVFRNFPLQESHQYATIAARATEAAALQDKYWEMHDAIFEQQSQLNEEFLFSLAERLELDLDQFREDIASAEVKEKVENDFESGVRSGVNGTPSFFVNDNKFDGDATDLFNVLKESGN